VSHWLQVATTIFGILWLCAVLTLLWFIWRSSVRHVQRIEQTLIDVSMKNAEIAQRAAQAALMIAERYQTERQPKKSG